MNKKLPILIFYPNLLSYIKTLLLFVLLCTKTFLGMPQGTQWGPAFAKASATFPIRC